MLIPKGVDAPSGRIPPEGVQGCRDTSLIRNSADLKPYGRAMPWALWWS